MENYKQSILDIPKHVKVFAEEWKFQKQTKTLQYKHSICIKGEKKPYIVIFREPDLQMRADC